MKSKSIRRKHDPFKRAQRIFNNVRLWSWESMREDGTQIAHGMARIGYIWRDLTQSQVTGIINQPNNWIIVCRALCRVGDEVWVEDESIGAWGIKVNELEDMYATMRKGVFESVQHRHVCDCGWIIQSFSDVLRIDDPKLPLFELGLVSQDRRAKWLLTDNEIKGIEA